MSTTVELVRANERYARLRAAIGALADEVAARAPINADGMIEHDRSSHSAYLACDLCPNFPHTSCVTITDLRALLAAVDS